MSAASWPFVGAGWCPGGLWYVVDIGAGCFEQGPIATRGEADILGHRHRLLGHSSRLYDGDTGKLIAILRAEPDDRYPSLWDGYR